jgi:Tripartite tricarboxylate transporter TctB family
VARWNADLIVALVAAALGLATLLLVPYQIAGESLAAIVNMQSPAFFPVFAGGLILVCAGTLAARSLLPAGAHAQERMEFANVGFVLAIGAIIILFAAACLVIGMIPSAAVTIICMGYLWGFRDLKILIPVAILVPTAIYLLFEKTLLIILPRGVVL